MSMGRTVAWVVLALTLVAGGASAAGGRGSIVAADLRTWLTYLASDQLEGRQVYTEGLGLAAGYIQTHLETWGLSPRGDERGYLQTVRVQGVKTTCHSSVTVKVGRETRTFKDGDGVVFPKNAGRKQTIVVDRVEFAGYGLDAPGAKYSDVAGKDFQNAAVIFLGTSPPSAVDAEAARRLMNGRGRWLTDQLKASAAIGPQSLRTPPRGSQAAADAPENARRPDFTTSRRLDRVIAPSLTADDSLLQFLFSRAPVKYDELKKRAESRDPLPSFRLEGVSVTFNVDDEYEVVRTQLTQNIVAVVEGSDPRLKSSYVAMGAHYDHVGYAEEELNDGKRRSSPGRITSGAEADRIWNGADDDGSGTVALMALARAFAEGPRPKRSLLFVWHAGEEAGLLGSAYFVDHPTVPIDQVVAQLNIDMIGRNRDNKASEADTVYLVGSDRISTELHDINRAANRATGKPLTLDYEMNDPGDPEQLYFRSDHYNYAQQGIPIIFFTTGLHPDYHANTDDVSKIEFPKMTRITEMVYETAWRLANLDHAPARDNKGPRAGKGVRE